MCRATYQAATQAILSIDFLQWPFDAIPALTLRPTAIAGVKLILDLVGVSRYSTEVHQIRKDVIMTLVISRGFKVWGTNPTGTLSAFGGVRQRRRYAGSKIQERLSAE